MRIIIKKWSGKYKKSIDCNNPKGFSQKAHCAGRKARQVGRDTKSKPVDEELMYGSEDVYGENYEEAPPLEVYDEELDRCARIAKRKYKVWPSAYACVPEKTSKALTRDGWKLVDELSIDEEILTFNLEKDILEFRPIQKIHRYKNVATNIIRSGNTGFVFQSTPNHKWVVKLPDTVSERRNKHTRNQNGYSLLETSEILDNRNNKLLVVSGLYSDGSGKLKSKVYKYGDNWISYLLESSQEQRQAWLFSAIVYDGNQKKTERVTENISLSALEWEYDGNHGKQSFGFKQKDIMHRDAFLLSAFLNEGMVTWKKVKDREIYSCNYTSNKRFKNASNFRIISEEVVDVWCPQTENSTWVMMQETNGQGIITITGNSGAAVKCRKGKIWKSLKEEEEFEEAKKRKYKPNFKREKEQGLHGWFARNRGKGWVNCRTGGPCGRESADSGGEYPACRPTHAQCKSAGKGPLRKKKGEEEVSWVEKAKKESIEMKLENIILEEMRAVKLELMSEGMQYHIETKTSLYNPIYRPGSKAFSTLMKEAREMYEMGHPFTLEESEMLEGDCGKYGMYEGKKVLLEVPMVEEELDEAEYHGKDVPLGKPQRGGSKKFYVYVKCGENVRKISFGDPNLSVKISSPERRRSFVARHNCTEKNDRCTAGYWSCRIGRYPSLTGSKTRYTWW